jgi:group II intron reverse transcriptase/maturase
MNTELERISRKSAENPKMVFTSLYHFINEEMLKTSHAKLDGKKAVGVDKVTKEEYSESLENNINALTEQLKRKSYRPKPSLRTYIPKGNTGKMRPLGIASYEDKLVQNALKEVIEVVFEPHFSDCMYGFRPGRGCHGAIEALSRLIITNKTSYVIDADIKGFFNNLNHDWIMKMVEQRIKDPNILWLIKKTLTAGVQEEGKWRKTDLGTEQGNLASPVIANIYMHYVLALWFEKVIKKSCRGECGIVIYADDFVATFQYKDEAERFMRELVDRLSKFGLELEESKTRLVEFGRFAEERRKEKGKGKPETFDFLGFTHYCNKTANGKFCVKRKTSRKKFNQKTQALNQWLKTNRHVKVKDLITMLNLKLRGHYGYFGITDNCRSMDSFRYKAEHMLFKWLNRRSQKSSYTWEGFRQMLDYNPLLRPKIYVNIC